MSEEEFEPTECVRCGADIDAEDEINHRDLYIFCDFCAGQWDYWWKNW